jgi:hypothetical protein
MDLAMYILGDFFHKHIWSLWLLFTPQRETFSLFNLTKYLIHSLCKYNPNKAVDNRPQMFVGEKPTLSFPIPCECQTYLATFHRKEMGTFIYVPRYLGTYLPLNDRLHFRILG